MLEIVKKAIENRNLLEFTYKNQRIVEPYTYGINSKSNELLSAYQKLQ
jgi:predicted DNA-binding transcriptional regulator YafY